MAKTLKDMLAASVLDVDLRSWITAEATRPQLEEFIQKRQLQVEGPDDPYVKLAQDTLHRKVAQAALRPHWSTWVALGISLVALIISLLSWLRPAQPAQPPSPTSGAAVGPSNSLPATSNLVLSPSTVSNTSLPVGRVP